MRGQSPICTAVFKQNFIHRSYSFSNFICIIICIYIHGEFLAVFLGCIGEFLAVYRRVFGGVRSKVIDS